jgi:hypothetical protein
MNQCPGITDAGYNKAAVSCRRLNSSAAAKPPHRLAGIVDPVPSADSTEQVRGEEIRLLATKFRA